MASFSYAFISKQKFVRILSKPSKTGAFYIVYFEKMTSKDVDRNLSHDLQISERIISWESWKSQNALYPPNKSSFVMHLYSIKFQAAWKRVYN